MRHVLPEQEGQVNEQGQMEGIVHLSMMMPNTPLRIRVAVIGTVVLGLVCSKTPQLESPDDLKRRIGEAGRYVPLERLALSPQCGFASIMEGNRLSPDDQRRKLEIIVETARAVWGA